MFHKVNSVTPLKDYKLLVKFVEGISKVYDTKPLFKWRKTFNSLKKDNLFNQVKVDVGGCGIIWNDELDLSCEELWSKGVKTKTPFDGLIAFSEATKLWNLNESTLRKAVQYGKLIDGVDVCKYGKQWIITVSSLIREYGNPEIK